jgi:hypothetical protein
MIGLCAIRRREASGAFMIFMAAAFVAASCGAALSQTRVAILRLTPMNTPTVFYFHSHVVDCQGVMDYAAPYYRLAKPAIVLVPEKPGHGTVSTREGYAPVQHCAGRTGAATIVTYSPEPGFSGFDNFRLRVLFDLRDRIVSSQVNVRVQVGGRGNPN